MNTAEQTCNCFQAVMDDSLNFLKKWTSSIDRLAKVLSKQGYEVLVSKTDRAKLLQVRLKGAHPFFFAIAHSGNEFLHTGRCELSTSW